MNLTLARTLNGIGRTLIGAGLLILLFVGYQLWGTNVQESRAQNRAEDEFNETLAALDQVDPALLESLRSTTSEAGDPTGSTTAAPVIPKEVVQLLSPVQGEPLALIRIPKIEVEKVVIHGTAVEDLRRGPGHYPETPLPGQRGNAAIAGHRTTYGAPFHNIDKLAPGDEIELVTVLGRVVYRVDQEPFVVDPSRVEVLDDVGDNRLTLTSCHPKFSAEERLIVTAKLVGAPLPDLPPQASTTQVETFATTTSADFVGAPTFPSTTASGGVASTTTATTAATARTAAVTTAVPADAEEDIPTLGGGAAAEPDLDQGLAGESDAVLPAIGWGSVALGTFVVAWLVARLWRHRNPERRVRPYLAYLALSPVFFFFLYLCFENVDRVLPAY